MSIDHKGYYTMKDQEDQPTKKYVIAIDVGTSGTKVGLVNQDGKVVAYCQWALRDPFLTQWRCGAGSSGMVAGDLKWG